MTGRDAVPVAAGGEGTRCCDVVGCGEESTTQEIVWKRSEKITAHYCDQHAAEMFGRMVGDAFQPKGERR